MLAHGLRCRLRVSGLDDAKQLSVILRRAAQRVVVRGPPRRAALDDNRRAIEETATLAAAGAAGSAAVLVLVAGGLPDRSERLTAARARVRDALAELVPEAQAMGLRSLSNLCTPCMPRTVRPSPPWVRP